VDNSVAEEVMAGAQGGKAQRIPPSPTTHQAA